VLHREADPATAFGLGREVAALIPDATLIPLPGASHLFYHGAWTETLDATLGFLAEGEPAAEAGPVSGALAPSWGPGWTWRSRRPGGG